jgi:glycosyltransferase involved in cell wall biosynthesis
LEETGIPLISVVVCTYNRADVLAGALESLTTQTLARNKYEVIIVDNNSTDHTADVIAAYCRRQKNFRTVLETRQGLSHARNRGWHESSAAYIGFVDDDCKLPEAFLTVAKKIIENVSPVAFGGPSYAFYDTPKPYWYLDQYASHKPFDRPHRLVGKACVHIYGMNMFFRRSALVLAGGFDPSFGMTGKKLAYSEETVLIKAISKAMPDACIYYAPNLYVYHLVQSERMNLRWIMRSRFAAGRYTIDRPNRAVGKAAKPGAMDSRMLKKAIKILRNILVDLAKGFFFRDRSRYPYLQNYLVESTCLYLYRLGAEMAPYSQRTRHLNTTP